MWAWIKAHKLLMGGIIAAIVVLYYVLKNYTASSNATPIDNSGSQLISGYGNPVVYSGGGVPIGAGTTATTAATTTANAPAPAAAPAAYNTPATVMPSTVAAPGTSPFNPGPSYNGIPTGAGWNQGTQPTATLGEGGMAIPVASGDFTTPYLREPGNPNSVLPGAFVNSQGYLSTASADFTKAALQQMETAKSHGYQAPDSSILGNSAVDLYAKGAFGPSASGPLSSGTSAPHETVLHGLFGV